MKNILIKSFVALAIIAGFNSCTDEQDLMFSKPEGSFKILSPNSGEGVVLDPTTLTNPGVSLTWEAKSYGSPTEITYTVQVDKSGDNFDTPINITSTTNTYATITSEVLNTKSLEAGLVPYTSSGLEIRIKSTIGTSASEEAFSDAITYIVKPYSTDLPKLYMTGNFLSNSGYGNNWTPANGVPIAASGFGQTSFEGFAYVNEASYAFLFLPTNVNFNGKYGDDGSFSGTLQAGGSDITGTGAGYYYVKANTAVTGPGALTYSLQQTNWAITGSATPLNWPSGPGGTAGQDQDMTYNQTTKKWQITIALTAGGNKFKFRANDDWGLNLGGDSADADSSMDFGGPDLEVPASGLYKVELDLSHPRDYSWTATLQ
ncbi:SusE domain-containing protein [Flavobacterium sp.]|uniref:SusE domain-containing protein n=1 Tax=Flavobacterium sp. TaxID=239 RepID=UPI003751438A